MSTELKQFESVKNMTKHELIALGNTDANALMDSGDYDSTTLAVSARKAVEYLGAFIATLDSFVMDELTMNGEGNIKMVLGSELSLGSTGDRLDFEKDAIYRNLNVQLKQRMALVKMATVDTEPIVDENGEIVEPVPIKTASRQTIRFKL